MAVAKGQGDGPSSDTGEEEVEAGAEGGYVRAWEEGRERGRPCDGPAGQKQSGLPQQVDLGHASVRAALHSRRDSDQLAEQSLAVSS
jgi:hypothetical protein